VRSAQRIKDTATLTAAEEALPDGFIVVPERNGPIAGLTKEETATAIASVDVTTVGIAGGLPRPAWWDYEMPPFSWATLWIILPFSFILAGVGLIESLMTLTLIDELTETRGRSNRECKGQGIANIVCGIMGGMGGCAMIGQSLINVKSGGRQRLSGITAAKRIFEVLDTPLGAQKTLAAPKRLSSDKINIASFANYLPKVHWHIMARFKTDSHFPEPVWGAKQREARLDLPPMDAFIERLQKRLAERKPSA
jgi:ABC-type multidrug transport system fused ATPase/permease subunit